MTEVEKLIERNNELRNLLTAENKEYYEQILIYIRTKSFFHDDLDIEKVLLEILQDILEAQKNSEKAVDYFGDNPQKMLDNILSQLPKISFKKRIGLIGIVFAISSGFSLFSTLTSTQPSINFLSLFFNGMISFIFVELIFHLINRQTFKPYKNKKREYFFAFCISFIFIGLTFLSNHFGGIWLSLSVPPYTGLTITWLAILILTIWVISKRKKDYYHIIFSLDILNLIPTLLKIPSFNSLVDSTIRKIVFIVFVLLLIYGSQFYYLKKEQKK